ncbi:MAG TPA: PorP/SprF family type IX secretion system membrane protein, partial [Bacteroidia bacterium]
MKNLYALSPLLFCIFFSTGKILAQDAVFTQTYSAPLWVNPALAGSSGAGRFTSIFRDQWPGLPANYKTYYASYDHFVNKIKSGLGFYYLHDQVDRLNTQRFALAFSHGFDLMDKKMKVVPGADISYVQQLFDTAGLYLLQPETFKTKINYPDISAGLQVYTSRLNFCFSAHHLTQPDQSFTSSGSRLPIRYTVIGDYVMGKIDEKRAWKFCPTLKYELQDQSSFLQAALAVAYHKFKFGAGYSTNHSLLMQVSYRGTLVH